MNVDAVLEAARRLPDVGITHRRTTISTVGWVPGLTRFVDEVSEPIRLALSLHAADPALRSELMPVNDRYPLADVLAHCRRYVERAPAKVFVEYVMLAGVNDAPVAGARARALLEPRRVQGEPDPLQPDGLLRRLVARGDRRVQGGARPGPRSRDGAAHPRSRHRRRVRAARRLPASPSACRRPRPASTRGPRRNDGRSSERSRGARRRSDLRDDVADADGAGLDDARVDPAEVERAPLGRVDEDHRVQAEALR